ncbi:MAG: ATPase, T2SS/T4P/T4SS family [Candidatus Omnitrophota bacterium]|nr:ATPase, T2SS/T4P/T4SS family [Candidatus Omnitrophota bacterium]
MMKEKFADYLIDKKLISKEDLSKALAEQKTKSGSLVEVLIKLGCMQEQQLLGILSGYLSIPPVHIANLTITKEILALITEKIARTYQVLPIGKIGSSITIAMADPLNILLIDDLKKITGCEINPVICSLSEIKEAISTHYSQTTTTTTALEEIIKDQKSEAIEIIHAKAEAVEEAIETIDEAPVIKFTNYLLERAVSERASDILIEPLEKVSRVRFRIDGILKEIETFLRKTHPFVVSRIKVMCNLNIAEHRLPQEGRFRITTLNRSVDFRVSILPSSLGEKAALRILDKTTALLDLNLLGFEEDVLKNLRRDSLKPHGLILVCGPTGSGKTTTLYSIISYIYTPEENIITVEDPIEYQLRGINQVSINPVINLTFASCLRSILRQDPDIIMVGEIRDYETADMAIKAALTGHLVLSTLHTTTSAGSITRLLNVGIEPFLLSSTLIGVLTQRLVRNLCPKCKEEFDVPDTIREKYSIEKKAKVYKAKGCNLCQTTGYKGRIALCEYLQVSPKMRSLISSNTSEHTIKREARLLGMHTLREDGLLKIAKGVTTIEEVLKVTGSDEPL